MVRLRLDDVATAFHTASDYFCQFCVSSHVNKTTNYTSMTNLNRHRASTSMYSLTFRVRVATPAQYGRNGTASLQITSHTQQARRFYHWCVPACVRSACGVR